MRKKEEKLTFTHLRGFDTCSLAQDFSPSPGRRECITHNSLITLHCPFDEIADMNLLEQSVGSGTFVVAVERTW